jgi:hypothetical protein
MPNVALAGPFFVHALDPSYMCEEPELAEQIYDGLRSVSSAITANSASGGPDETGGHVECLTEAVMGMTSALSRIADGLYEIARAIEEK